MYDSGDGQYETSSPRGSGGGVLGKTVRNAVVLLVVLFLVAWAMSGIGNIGRNIAPPAPENAGLEQTGPSSEVRRAPDGNYELVVPAGPFGHFVLDATVNGVDVRFLVDTGASTVTLTQEDARRIGIRPDLLDYSARFRTANGEILAAPVTLREVQIDDLALQDVESTVTRAPLNISLLGMSFLTRLAGYEVRDEGLVLRW
ncbi:MAG: TIGR02281 family clan AA aspartic protease [Kiloniellaceae bacterium]